MKACLICLSTYEDSVKFCPFHGVELKPIPQWHISAGETVCGYYLRKSLGHDALGDLYLAPKDSNTFRVRVFGSALLADTKRAERVADILEKNQHLSGGGIPAVDYGWSEEGALYCAHPYIPGRSFQDIIDMKMPLSEDDAAALLYQLLRAIKDVHAQNIVHGNLSLNNIIIDNSGRIRLYDCGFWSVLRDRHFSELIEDSPEVFSDIVDLMSPEVARGEAAKVYSDVYSCGAAAQCLLTLQAGVGSAAARMQRHVSGEVQDIRRLRPGLRVSRDFAELLQAAMVGTHGVRFQTPRAFITALQSVHPEIDENAEILPVSLSEKLLSGAERPTNLSAGATGKGQTKAERVEVTRSGLGECSAGKTSFSELGSLVGDRLCEDRTAMESLPTTEMDAFESTPTTEIERPLFSTSENTVRTSADELLEDLFEEKSSARSKPSDADALFADIFKAASNAEKAARAQKSALESVLSAEVPLRDMTAHLADGSETQDIAAHSADSSETQDIAAHLADGSETQDSAAHLADGSETQDIAAHLADGSETQDAAAHSADGSETQDAAEPASSADALQDDESRANDTESAEHSADAADEHADASRESLADSVNIKPHKRIGRKGTGTELERGDVVSMSESMEMRRVKRRRRQNVRPVGDITIAETIINPISDKEMMPEYSKIPSLTSTNGYQIDEDAQEVIEDILPSAEKSAEASALSASAISSEDVSSAVTPILMTVPDPKQLADYDAAKSPSPAPESERTPGAEHEDTEDDSEEDSDDDASWFDEPTPAVPDQKRSLIKIVIAILIVLIFICAIALAVKLTGNASDDDNASSMDGVIAQFESVLKEGTPESRLTARDLFKEISKSSQKQSTIRACREKYINALTEQVSTLTKAAVPSAEMTDYLDTAKADDDINEKYNLCIAAIENTAENPDATQACEQERDSGHRNVSREALKTAQMHKGDIENQIKKWQEIASIYEDIKQNLRNTSSNALISDAQSKAVKEEAEYQRRLNDLTKKSELAALENTGSPNIPNIPAAAADASADSGTALNPAIADNANSLGASDVMPENTANTNLEPAVAAAEPVHAAAPEPAAAEPAIAAAKPAPAEPVRQNANQEVQAAAAVPSAPKPSSNLRVDLRVDDAPAMPKADDISVNKKADSAETKKPEEKRVMLVDDPEPAAKPAAAKPSTGSMTNEAGVFILPTKADKAKAESANQAPAPVKRIALDDEEEPKAPTPQKSADSASGGSVPTGKLIADAQAAMAKHSFAEAAKLLTQATKQDPKNYRAWFSLAKASEGIGNMGEAIKDAEKACSIQKTANCYVYVGDLNKKAGNADAARAAYAKALELDPNNAAAKAKSGL